MRFKINNGTAAPEALLELPNVNHQKQIHQSGHHAKVTLCISIVSHSFQVQAVFKDALQSLALTFVWYLFDGTETSRDWKRVKATK